jgi:uncharacterized protein YhjY with autotransporter beta-barrel domain
VGYGKHDGSCSAQDKRALRMPMRLLVVCIACFGFTPVFGQNLSLSGGTFWQIGYQQVNTVQQESVQGNLVATLAIDNPNAFPFTTDTAIVVSIVPSGMTVSGVSNTCGLVLPAPVNNTVMIPVGTIFPPGNGQYSCYIYGSVLAAATGVYTANVAGLSFSSVSSVTVTANAVAPSIDALFSPSLIQPGGTSTLIIDLVNPDASPATLTAAFSATLPSGMTVAGAATVSSFAGTNCPANLLNAAIGQSTITFGAGAIIPVADRCEIRVPVTIAVDGMYSISFPANALQDAAGGSVATGSFGLNVGLPPTVSATFAPATITAGSASTLSLILGNPTTVPAPLLGVGTAVFTLPAGVTIASNPALGGTCPSVTATAGGASISIGPSLVLPAVTGCTVSVNVTAATAGTYTEAAPAGTLVTAYGSSVAATAVSLTVTGTSAPPSVTPSFSPAAVAVNTNSVLTLNFGNTNASAATLTAAFQLSLPAGLTVASVPGVGGTCTAGSVGAAGGATAITYASAATIPAGGCTVTVNVVAATPASYLAVISTGTLVTSLGTNAATTSATLVVGSPPTLGAAFNPTTIAPNGTSVLTLTLGNSNSVAATLSKALPDALPAGLVVASTPAIGGTCAAGSVTAAAGAGTVTFASGATVPATPGCTITVSVTSAASGTYTDTIAAGALATNFGATAAATSAQLTVGNLPTLSAAFNPTTIAPNATSILTLTLGNPNATAATLTQTLADALPSGLVVAGKPAIGGTCAAASVAAAAGAGTITFASGAALPATTGCTITVNVTSATAGSYTDTLAAGALVTNLGANAAAASSVLTVGAAPTISVAFNPGTIAPNATSALTLTLGNSNSTAATLTQALTDTLPAGLVVAPGTAGIGGTCAAGSVTAAMGTITLATGASVPATSGCTIIVNVTSAASGTYTDAIAAGALGTNFGANAAAASAALIVQVPAVAPTVSLAFAPASVSQGKASALTISLGNANSGAATLSQAFTDTLPSGLVVASPAAISGTCAPGSVGAAAGAGAITFANGASIPTGGCTITVNVTSGAAGTYADTVSVGALQTLLGSNSVAGSATLKVTQPGLPSVSGQSLTAATAVLTGLGLQVAKQYTTSSQPYNTVIGQNPPAGTVVAGNTTVTLIVSSGTASNPNKPLSTSAAVLAAPAAPALVSVAQGVENTCNTLSQTTSVLTSAQQKLLTACTAIIQSLGGASATPAQIQAVTNTLNAVSGRQMTAQQRASVEMAGGQLTNVGDRLSQLRAGDRGINLSGLNIEMPIDAAASTAASLARTPILNVGKDVWNNLVGGNSGDAPGGILGDKLGIFVNGSIKRGSRDQTGDETGFDFKSTGVTGGIDYRFTDHTVWGLAFSHAPSTTTFTDGSGRVDARSNAGSIFGTYYRPSYYVDWLGSFGHNTYDSTRIVSCSVSNCGVDLSATALGSTGAKQYAFATSGGWNFRSGPFVFGPDLAINYLQVNINGFVESGDSGLELAYGDQVGKSLLTKLGVHGSYAWSTRFAVISPQIQARYLHEFMNAAQSAVVQFAADTFNSAPGTPGSDSFKVFTDQPDRNYFDWRAGVVAQFPFGAAFYVQYAATEGLQYTRMHDFGFGLRIQTKVP